MILRIAELNDAEHVLAIYAPFILNTPISYETVVPTLNEFEQRIETILLTYPWLVCEDEGKVIGYTYASKYRERPAYQWNCESSIYIDDTSQQKGIGSKLYHALFTILKLQGFVNLYAVIGTPNPKSEAFHRSLGFRPCAVFSNTGFKMGAWHDVNWYHLMLNTPLSNHKEPIPFSEFKHDPRIKEILSQY